MLAKNEADPAAVAPARRTTGAITRTDVTFRTSGGQTCGGWWYSPAETGKRPVVVMGHGLGGTRELGLDAYARRFAAEGFAVLAFDYRHYGDSTGSPRELLSIGRQLRDFRDAIAFARSWPDVDPSRVAIWGSSFGGGHVMTLAAEDLGLRAAVAQVPFSSGLASTFKIPTLTAARLAVAALLDVARALVGMGPQYVKLLGTPGEVALMSAPDCDPGYRTLLPPGLEASERWRNRVAARIALAISFYAPGRRLARSRVPILVAVADDDSIAPAAPTVRAAARAPRAELVRYPGGHFDGYTGEAFERAVSDEIAFLKKHLA